MSSLTWSLIFETPDGIKRIESLKVLRIPGFSLFWFFGIPIALGRLVTIDFSEVDHDADQKCLYAIIRL